MATIESIGSSTRIEGAKLTDAEVEDLLSRAISIESFKTRDEQEVAGVPYASLERVIEENKDLYSKALRRTQNGHETGYNLPRSTEIAFISV